MTSLVEGTSAVIDHLGEDMTLNGVALKGIVRVVGPSEARNVMAQATADASARPMYRVFIKASVAIPAFPTVVYNGQNYGILFSRLHVVAGVAIYRSLNIAQEPGPV